MFDFIAYPIGKLLKLIYDTLSFKNYGVSIILLTVIIKTLLLPLIIKQYRSTAKITEIQPKIQEIQNKYKNDKEKINVEMMKLYNENKINPAGGCLPLLIQMPILFSLYYVISQPLKYMYGISSAVINQLYGMIPIGPERIPNLFDLSIINFFTKNTDKLQSVSNLITKDQLLNMNFFDINLGAIPSLDFNKLFGNQVNIQSWLLLIIPVLSVVTTYISIKYSSQQSIQNSDKQMGNSMQKSMSLISPLMTGFISFSVPAGLGVYWIISNLLQIFQQAFMNKIIYKKNRNSEKKVLYKTQ